MIGQKVLVVDDEPKIVSVVRDYLVRDGFRVVEAYDGFSALELARREGPDLIVLDLMLPRISGLEVCRTLLRIKRGPSSCSRRAPRSRTSSSGWAWEPTTVYDGG